MTPTYTRAPFDGYATFFKLTGAKYDEMVQSGVIEEDDRVELLDGYMVQKMAGNPPHDSTVIRADRWLYRLVPPGWVVRSQVGTKLTHSRPEPDVAVARGDDRTYDTRHPNPADLGLVVEVSDSSLDRDQQEKAYIYARDGIPVYWIVNLVDRRVEVYTDPTGPADVPQYQTRTDYLPGSAVPVVLDGAAVGTVPVDELLP